MRTASLVLLTCIAAGAFGADGASARTRHAHARAHAGGAPSSASAPTPDIVQIDAGQVRGLTVDGVDAFKGVPFAEPPLGELRWRAPRPPKPWTGVLAADRFGPNCMQAADVPQSEDCLTLNVWRAAAHSDRPLPVVVWIHGGDLIQGGSAEAPGDRLAKQGVVVVSMNYRLGRFGFFAHPALAAEAPDEAHGDYGYLDQIAALAWVQRNIAAFGGDPKMVTIVGRVDDGSVMTHLTSPLSRGLFERAVIEAPGRPNDLAAPLPVTDLGEAQRRAVEYAMSLGLAGDGADALGRLRAVPAEQLVDGAAADAVLNAVSRGVYVPGVSGPIRDGRLILEAPDAAIAARRQAMAPLLVAADDPDFGLDAVTAKDALFALFGRDADEARKLYDPKGDQGLDALKQLVSADAARDEPARRLAEEAARSGQPTWFYRFAYTTPAPRKHRKSAPPSPASGSYVFRLPDDGPGTPDALAQAYLTSFVMTGDPNGPGRPAWPRYEPAQDKGAAAQQPPSKARPDLWRAVSDDAGPAPEARGDPLAVRSER